MTEKPIIFSTPMVQAILEGRKTQTRRVLKLKKGDTVGNISDSSGILEYIICGKDGDEVPMEFVSPYGVDGDRLWVRETHYRYGSWWHTVIGDKNIIEFKPFSNEVYFQDNLPKGVKILTRRFPSEQAWYKRPSIFMPKWASRINLEVTKIRVQKLQDISEEDCEAEGFKAGNRHTVAGIGIDPHIGWIHYVTAYSQFHSLWDKLNEKRGYSMFSNPFVWAISFKRIK